MKIKSSEKNYRKKHLCIELKTNKELRKYNRNYTTMKTETLVCQKLMQLKPHNQSC